MPSPHLLFFLLQPCLFSFPNSTSPCRVTPQIIHQCFTNIFFNNSTIKSPKLAFLHLVMIKTKSKWKEALKRCQLLFRIRTLHWKRSVTKFYEERIDGVVHISKPLFVMSAYSKRRLLCFCWTFAFHDNFTLTKLRH